MKEKTPNAQTQAAMTEDWLELDAASAQARVGQRAEHFFDRRARLPLDQRRRNAPDHDEMRHDTGTPQAQA